ncbi:MAG: hypothetical protein P4L84_33005 [Isosphaeraceae bacterium]|nr:hypothetical protein [Isosphaeraceae bacterium]
MIIFDSTSRHVKPATRKPFAAGLTINPTRAPYSLTDLAWASQHLNAATRDYRVTGISDSVLEQAAGCALAIARLELGFCPF